MCDQAKTVLVVDENNPPLGSDEIKARARMAKAIRVALLAWHDIGLPIVDGEQGHKEALAITAGKIYRDLQ